VEAAALPVIEARACSLRPTLSVRLREPRVRLTNWQSLRLRLRARQIVTSTTRHARCRAAFDVIGPARPSRQSLRSCHVGRCDAGPQATGQALRCRRRASMRCHATCGGFGLVEGAQTEACPPRSPHAPPSLVRGTCGGSLMRWAQRLTASAAWTS